MKHPFNTLTKYDVQRLRKKSMSVKAQGVNYNFTSSDLDNARKHLQTIYSGTVRESFAAKILLLNEIY